MKLIWKITLLYLLISLVVFMVGGYITYQVIKREIDFEQERFLNERLQSAMRMIERRNLSRPFIRDKISIIPIGPDGQESEIIYSDTLVMHQTLQRMEPHKRLDVIKKAGNQFYKITIFDLIVEEDDIQEGVLESLVIMYSILFAVFVLFSGTTSYWLLRPFNKTLQQIKKFSLRKGKSIEYKKSRTKEFDKLNQFLNEMTNKVQNDYYSLKEFSENASHEIQTPLSIATGKLELLLESDSLSEEQLQLVISAQESIKRISKIGNALSLLTKIENKEFKNVQDIDLGELLKRTLLDFKEVAELKSIQIESEIKKGIKLKIDETLATILLTNLIQNAIRHNFKGGKLRIILNDDKLSVWNTGEKPSSDPEKMFERFTKNKTNEESIGLGLAIVKKICDESGLNINYTYRSEGHLVEVKF